MEADPKVQRLDRHALVMAIWPAFGLIAAALFSYGFRANEAEFILAGFVAVIAGFIGHIIINAALGSDFTSRELALGMVLYAAALVGFMIATLLSREIGRHFLLVSVGFLGTFIVVVFYLVTYFGVSRVFAAFDTIRDFRPRYGRDEPREDGA